MNEPLAYEWVVGLYKGDIAKRVKAQAESGIGYVIVGETGVGASHQVKAAFRRPKIGPIPDHLAPVNLMDAQRLDDRLQRDAPKVHSEARTASAETLAKVRAVFFDKRRQSPQAAADSKTDLSFLDAKQAAAGEHTDRTDSGSA